MKTLNEQHRLIKQGKGHKDVFLKEAKKQFPEWIRTAATYNETAGILKNKGIINENLISLEPINQLVSPPKPDYEIAFNNYLKEAKKKKDVKSDDAKAEEKEVSKQVKKAESKNFDRKNMENPDNLIFDQIMKGYYCEMKNEKNSKKTMEELKKIVLKNLTKDPIYYTKNGQFGEDGIGYETEVPGLGTPKEPKGKYKASGYGDLDKATKARLSESKLRKSINTLIREELGENTVDLKESHQPGDKVIYKGTKYEVVDEDEFIITLKDEEGNITKQNYNQFKQGEYKPDLQESKLRNVINTLVKQQIQENVQKELQQIDKEAQFEILASKLEKIEAAIEKRQSQLDRLDEDEDLKNLTDKKKLKALGKDIKVLGKAKAKIEKELAKKDKSDQPQPEMIDDGMIDEAEGDVDDAKATADEMERAAKAAKQIGDTELFEDEVFFEELED